MKRVLHAFLFAALVAGASLASDARAQQRSPSQTNLPAWAEPGQSAERGGRAGRNAEPPSNRRFREQSSVQAQDGPTTDVTPPPPAPPPQVPVGGLEWLALAGGAYAVRRLSKGDGEQADEEIS